MMYELVETWWSALSNSRGFREVNWRAVYLGHELLVATRGMRRARLLLDGVCVDERSPLLALSRSIPLLSGRLVTERPGAWIVEAYVNGPFATKVALRVNGRPVAVVLELAKD